MNFKLPTLSSIGITSLFLVCLSISSPSFCQTTVVSTIGAESDDAEEYVSNGNMNLTSSDLELTYEGGSAANDQYVGIRFIDVNVPPGSFITNAFLTFNHDSDNNGLTNLVIRAEDIDNAPTFTTANSNISNRTLTTATANWNNVVPWTGNNDYDSPNISNVIQEVIDRPGWAQNNELVVVITGTGEREAEAGPGGDAARLTITYIPCPNAIPTFALGANSTRCQGVGNVTYSASSAGSTSIVYSLDATSLAAGNTINSATGEVTYSAGWSGTTTITAMSYVGVSCPKSQTHEVSVSASSPVISFPGTLPGGRCIGQSNEVFAADPIPGFSIIYSIDATSAANGVIIEDTTASVYFPSSWSGVTTITASATSVCGSSSSDYVVTTGEVVAIDDAAFCSFNGSVATIVTDNDICDIDPNSVSIVSGPSNGSVVVGANGEITYTPAIGFSGVDSYTYEVCGLLAPGICTQATVVIEVSQFFTDDYFNSVPSNCEVTPPSSAFGIQLQYEITDEPVALYGNAQVADIDGNGTQEILALGDDDYSSSDPRHISGIHVFNGADGSFVRTIATPILSYEGPSPFSVADLDDDGDCEIIVATMHDPNTGTDQRRLFCYDHFGNQLWQSNVRYQDFTGNIHGAGGDEATAPHVGIADFNQDGTPEVYVYNEIFNALTGVKLCDGGANGKGHQDNYRNQQAGVTVAADIRPSPGLELAAGPTVYDVTITNTAGTAGNSMVANNFTSGLVSGSTIEEYDGLTAIADINLDGVGDVIVVSYLSEVYAYNPVTMTLIAHRNTGEGTDDGHGGLFIGDVDGDGTPNIGYCRDNNVDMLTYNGTNTFQLKWTLGTTDGSGRTGLTMFDFNQDGTQEIIYRDEDNLRIFDGSGATPLVLTSIPSTSSTGMEGPIVADVDNDSEAEILVTSRVNYTGSSRLGYMGVYGSSASAWAPARNVWNQWAFYNTHIQDDMGIPTVMPNHWEQFFSLPTTCPAVFQQRPLNTFNVQSTFYSNDGCPEFPAPDAALSVTNSDVDCNTNELTVNYTIQNYGDEAAILPSISVSFYLGNPTLPGATLLSTETYVGTIPPNGSSGVISSTHTGIIPGSTIYAVVNDNGSQAPPLSFPINGQEECNYANNIIAFAANCPSLLPVELISFGAVKSGRHALLSWETASEINNDYFVVERSADGSVFQPIGTIDGKGTTQEHQSYTLIDKQPWAGINYYRLRQVDYDGKITYSEVHSLDFRKDEITVYPNPANETIGISNPHDRVQLIVRDLSGKVVKVRIIEHGIETLDVSELGSGMYFFEFTNTLSQDMELIKIRIL